MRKEDKILPVPSLQKKKKKIFSFVLEKKKQKKNVQLSCIIEASTIRI